MILSSWQKKKSKTHTKKDNRLTKKKSSLVSLSGVLLLFIVVISIFGNWNKSVILHFCFCNKGAQDTGTKSKSAPVV